MASKVDEIRTRLERELEATIARLRELDSPLNPDSSEEASRDPSGDPFDRIEAMQSRERQIDAWGRLAGRVEELYRALEALRAGTYGTCAECGEAIGWARLRARPAATTCVRCQDRLERTRSGAPRAFYTPAARAQLDDEAEA